IVHRRPPPPTSTPFPYTTLFRSSPHPSEAGRSRTARPRAAPLRGGERRPTRSPHQVGARAPLSAASTPSVPNEKTARASTEHPRSEEHTSELQSPYDLVCRLLLE